MSKFPSSVVILILLASCSVSSNTNNGPIKIDFLAHASISGNAENAVLVDQVKRFNESQTAYKIEMVSVGDDGYESELDKYAQKNALPCVVEFDGPFVYNYAWRGLLKPLDRLITKEMKEDFLDSIIQQGTYEGFLFSLGAYESGLALWGNKRILADNGISVPTQIDNAWTLAEFESHLQTLKHAYKDDASFYPLDMKFGYGAGEWYSYGYAPIIQSFGGDLINRGSLKTSEQVLNSESTILAFATIKSWIAKGWVNKNQPSDEKDFIEGKSAISYVGHWMYQSYKEALGDNLVLIPMPKFGNQAKTGNGSWNFGISAHCGNPEGAWKFLEFILSPDEIIAMTSVNGAIPSRKSALNKAQNLYGSNGALHVYVDQLNANIAVPRPQTPAYLAIRQAFSDAFLNSVVGNSDYKTELDAAVLSIKNDFQRNNNYVFTPPSRY